MLASCCLVSAWRHPISLALSCLVVAVPTECAGLVISPTVSSTHSRCHSDILPVLSVLPLHYKIVKEERGYIHDILLRVGKRNTVLVISSLSSAHFLKRRRSLLLPFLTPSIPITLSQVWWSVPTLALKSPRKKSLSVRGAAEITESRSS